MVEYKSEIENWDLGAGVYISFYSIRSSLLDNDSIMGEPVSTICFSEASVDQQEI